MNDTRNHLLQTAQNLRAHLERKATEGDLDDQDHAKVRLESKRLLHILSAYIDGLSLTAISAESLLGKEIVEMEKSVLKEEPDYKRYLRLKQLLDGDDLVEASRWLDRYRGL